MPPRKTALALFLALIVPSVMLVSLQQDSTDRNAPTNQILFGYFAGTGPLEVVGNAGAVSIVEARCLVREVLSLCGPSTPAELYLDNTVVQCLFVWAALCTIYLTAARLVPPAWACAAVFVTVAFVPWGYASVGFSVSWPYDLPVLFFSALGLWAIVARRFAVFALALVVGTLNKETVGFLLPAYVLAEWPLLPWKASVARALILAGLFLAAYEIPRLTLAGGHWPVATFSTVDNDLPRWQGNFQHLLFQKRTTKFENAYWPLSLHLPVLLRLSALPWPLRAAYLAVPIFLASIFLCGNLYELRLYNEIIPLGAIGAVLVFARLFETPAAPLAADPRPTAS